MPVSYRFDSGIIVIEMIGEYPLDDIRKAVLDSLSDPACPANPRLIIDLTGSRIINERTPNEVRSVAGFVASLGDKFSNRIALVAPTNSKYGLMRMSSIGAEDKGIESGIFRNLDDALDWQRS